MAEEKWDRFFTTGSVRDYLAYRACVADEPQQLCVEKREELTDGTDHPFERDRIIGNAGR
ncbi:MAG: hypothetical protein PUD20_05985 [bacterium]|nr:hypothetical protein [bacterium]